MIGWLFLLQAIAAFGLGLAVLAVPGRFALARRLVAAAGAVFALATLGGYLLSVSFGLFGFKEVRTTAGVAAGLIEVAVFVVLATLAWLPAAIARPARMTTTALTVASLVLLGIAVAGAGPAASMATGSGVGLMTTVIDGTTVLSSSPITGTRCTPTSGTRPPVRPGAITSTLTAGSGMKSAFPGERPLRPWDLRSVLCTD